MRRLTLLVVLVAFTFSCGGEWPVLQGVAWANMIREYSEVAPLGEAVQMTFSGGHPCSLCKMITQNSRSENLKAAALFPPENKIVSPILLVRARSMAFSRPIYIVRNSVFLTRSEAPPTPPPRLA